MAAGTDTYPDPLIRPFRQWLVFPWFVRSEAHQGNRRGRKKASWLLDPDVVEPPPGAAWSVMPPEGLKRAHLDRWFFREVQYLFFADDKVDAADDRRQIPRIRWITYDPARRGAGSEDSNLPEFSENMKLAVLARRRSTDSCTVRILPDGFTVTPWALVSKAGVILLVVELQHRKGLRLSEAMTINYLAAHATHPAEESAVTSLVLVPHQLLARLRKDRYLAASADDVALSTGKTDEFELPIAELGTCLLVGTLRPTGTPRTGAEPPSLVDALAGSIGRHLGGHDLELASPGRLPIASHLLIDDDCPDGQAEPDGHQEKLEALVARCHRHPSVAAIRPLPVRLLEGEEFRVVHVTGSQRFYLTCEGFFAIGHASTPFDRTWSDRVGKEYLLTFLMAVHQFVACQMLSWRSYVEASARRNERLMADFLAYSTDYGFTAVSQQFNIQRLYRTARMTLGVGRLEREVRDELESWVDNQLRLDQLALNSLAVVAGLVAFTTFFIGLNFDFLTQDSKVSLIWDFTRGLWQPSIWFWVPVAIAGLLFLARSNREHLKRVLALLGFRSRRGDR